MEVGFGFPIADDVQLGRSRQIVKGCVIVLVSIDMFKDDVDKAGAVYVPHFANQVYVLVHLGHLPAHLACCGACTQIIHPECHCCLGNLPPFRDEL